MSFPTTWRDYNTQRARRYRLVPRLIACARPFTTDHSQLAYQIREGLERSRQLQAFGLTLLSEQFDQEKKLSKEIRAFLIRCHSHHALIAKNNFQELQHELLDAEAHLNTLASLITGRLRV